MGLLRRTFKARTQWLTSSKRTQTGQSEHDQLVKHISMTVMKQSSPLIIQNENPLQAKWPMEPFLSPVSVVLRR